MSDQNDRDLAHRRTLSLLDELDQGVAQVNALSPETDNLGKMSAEAVRAQYEVAAKAFEIMGDEVKDRIDKLHASLELADASMKQLAEAAAAIREEGRLAHTQIEEMSGVAKLIHHLHGQVMKKITGRLPTLEEDRR
jgi:uncharacterized coiled-coil DUF342 family protein